MAWKWEVVVAVAGRIVRRFIGLQLRILRCFTVGGASMWNRDMVSILRKLLFCRCVMQLVRARVFSVFGGTACFGVCVCVCAIHFFSSLIILFFLF